MDNFRILNFSLLGNPINWIIVVLMLLIASIALDKIMNKGS